MGPIQEIKTEIGYEFPSGTVFKKREKGLELVFKNGKLTVLYSSPRDILRAALIAKANDDLKEYRVEEKNEFDDVCFMLDCSRNAVRNIATVKKLIRNLAMLGYNSLMLYTEDTYEVDGEPLFGYLRGRYGKEELKELDRYATECGIELIPCIQTLAHLNQIKRYSVSRFQCFDCMDILQVGKAQTYELIEKMFHTIAECFSSKRIHVGMDEAWLLGKGNYLTENGYRKKFDIICEHLDSVCKLAKRYGFTPIIWSDIFCNAVKEQLASETNEGVAWKKILAKVPKNLELCCWEYHGLTPDHFKDKLELHKRFSNPVWFAGGTIQMNRGFLPHLTYSTKISGAAIDCATESGIKKLLATAWGDNGGEGSIFATLPAIAFYSYKALGIENARLEKEFLALTGYTYRDFLTLEYAQTFCGEYTNDIGNPAKYGLYSDPFSGYIDVAIRAEDEKYFVQAKKQIKSLQKGQYDYLFKSAYRLNDVLSLKYGLGIRLRKAYREKDRGALYACAEEMKKIVSKLTSFIEMYRRQWYAENKPFGLEIQEIRLGGLKERLKGCRKIVLAYLNGELKSIAELEEELLPPAVARRRAGNRCDEFSYEAIASVNVFDGFTDIDV